jgi:lipoprotein-anchoring transpeptidase ErfK/SrfK
LAYVLLATLTLLLLAAVGAIVLAVTATPSISQDGQALARLDLPFGTGTLKTLSVVGGRERNLIPVRLTDGRIWPRTRLAVGEPVTVVAVVRRPGWLSWLTGSTQTVRVTFRTPAAELSSHYLTVPHDRPLTLAFTHPVRLLEYGQAGRLRPRVLSSPHTRIAVSGLASAGSMWVAVAPRVWEKPRPSLIDWFPAGAAATAIANPTPGSRLTSNSPITLTFSKPLAQVLGTRLPPVSPETQGSWRTVNSHTISFTPTGYGYGLGAHVSVALPAGVRLLGGQLRGAESAASWSVPPGSTLRLQQLLAGLGYLPLRFHASTPAPTTIAGQEAEAVSPPHGTFSWRYPNTPSQLQSMWQPGASGVITRGAVMAFESSRGLSADGVAGPETWKSLIAASLAGHTSSFGYTFVTVSQSLPESLRLWHNGHTVLSTAVNTGIPASPTANGVYPVYLRFVTTTMSGTNPDGSHYSDPGIPWVSYFNGGDALHGFIRGSYGSPQSLGCVEMTFAAAKQVYPYTPIGTLVSVI